MGELLSAALRFDTAGNADRDSPVLADRKQAALGASCDNEPGAVLPCAHSFSSTVTIATAETSFLDEQQLIHARARLNGGAAKVKDRVMKIMNLDEYCRLIYGLKEDQMPTKSQRNTVSAMCRVGTLDAFKSGRRWLIRLKEV